MRNFPTDLITGHIAENLFIDVLATKAVFTDFKHNTDKAHLEDYDISYNHNGRYTTAEVKHDLKSDFTGNLAIEYWNTKQMKHSGINATKADIFVIQIKDRFLVFPTQDLKALAFDSKRKFKQGSTDNSLLILIPISVAEPFAKSISITRIAA